MIADVPSIAACGSLKELQGPSKASGKHAKIIAFRNKATQVYRAAVSNRLSDAWPTKIACLAATLVARAPGDGRSMGDAVAALPKTHYHFNGLAQKFPQLSPIGTPECLPEWHPI
jgi:hypothetical protein